jgi:hypothetical protein
LFTFACAPPSGADWPTNCQPEVLAVDLPLTLQLNADDVAIVGTGDGGFLLVVTGGWGSFVQYVAVAPGQPSQDAGWLDCMTEACPASTLGFVPGASGQPPTLVGGYQPAGIGGMFSPSQFACWAPFSGTPTPPLAIPNGGGADQVAPALSTDGQLGVAVMDGTNSVVLTGFGDAGACPTSLSVVTHVGSSTANGISLTSTGQPALSGAAFVVGEAITNSSNFENELGLEIEPDGGLIEQAVYGSSSDEPFVPPLALASDGVTVSALTADQESGIQLFTYALPGFQEIYDGGVVAPQPNATGPAAANCGPDCTLATWTFQTDGGETTPAYAVMNAEGCGAGGLLSPIATDGGTLNVSFVAAAAGPGLGAIAVASTVSSATCGLGTCIYDTRVYVSFCTP